MKHELIDILWHIRDRLSVIGVNDVRWYADRIRHRIGRLGRILHEVDST